MGFEGRALGVTEGLGLGLRVEGRRVGLVVGLKVGAVDGALGTEVGFANTNPPPTVKSTPDAIATSAYPSWFRSPAPLTTTPPPVITTPCETVILAILVIVTVLFP